MTALFDLTDTGIVIPALTRPSVEEIRIGRDGVIDTIQRDCSPTGPVSLQIARVIGATEESIDWEEYLRRTEGRILLGYQHACWLRENRLSFSQEILSLLWQIIPKNFIDFPGVVVQHRNGSFGVPTICQGFDVHIMSLDFVFHRRVAVGVPVS